MGGGHHIRDRRFIAVFLHKGIHGFLKLILQFCRGIRPFHDGFNTDGNMPFKKQGTFGNDNITGGI